MVILAVNSLLADRLVVHLDIECPFAVVAATVFFLIPYIGRTDCNVLFIGHLTGNPFTNVDWITTNKNSTDIPVDISLDVLLRFNFIR
ncbi:MAG: hypothetical protein CXX75_03715 [Methanobacteriota archaeon]|nr:MAG: hypothetical protein CXX75_03715 [Euryarchaeota archaeon]